MATQHNIGFQSEFIISQLEATVIDQPDFFVLQTPSNPNYYFGNLLALKVPLSTHSKTQWLRIFEGAFSNLPEVNHYTFSWVRDPKENLESIQAFTDENFEFEESHILGMTRDEFKVAEQLNTEVNLRPLTSETEWQQWIELSVLEQEGDHSEQGLREYFKLKAANYRKLADQNLGEYLGAFFNDELIGFAGLYHKDSLARFQSVLVAPRHQNKKIAKTLLTRLTERAPSDIEQFIIVADEHYHATKLYQSLGFKVIERECSLCWWPASQRKQS